MEWKLENPMNGLKEVRIDHLYGGYGLYIQWERESSGHYYDDYRFKTDTGAKIYFGKHFQNINMGSEKPKWVKK